MWDHQRPFSLATNTIRTVLRKRTRKEINGELAQVRDQRPGKSLEDDYSNQEREWVPELESDSENWKEGIWKYLPAMQEIPVQSLGQEDPPEKGIATYSSILTWRIPWTEEPGGL